MKLLTHNMLACHIKGVKNNYPFIIEAVQVETRDADFNPGARMLRLDAWQLNCLAACSSVHHGSQQQQQARNQASTRAWPLPLRRCRLPEAHIPQNKLASVLAGRSGGEKRSARGCGYLFEHGLGGRRGGCMSFRP